MKFISFAYSILEDEVLSKCSENIVCCPNYIIKIGTYNGVLLEVRGDNKKLGVLSLLPFVPEKREGGRGMKPITLLVGRNNIFAVFPYESRRFFLLFVFQGVSLWLEKSSMGHTKSKKKIFHMVLIVTK